jgi:hypothetical protein
MWWMIPTSAQLFKLIWWIIPTTTQVLKHALSHTIHRDCNMLRSTSYHPQGVYIKQAYINTHELSNTLTFLFLKNCRCHKACSSCVCVLNWSVWCGYQHYRIVRVHISGTASAWFASWAVQLAHSVNPTFLYAKIVLIATSTCRLFQSDLTMPYQLKILFTLWFQSPQHNHVISTSC